jgi:translation initiation factor 5A
MEIKPDENETFESADAGASLTYPQQAGTIRKGGFIVINGHPCKVADVSTSKTGKHGHAKCHFVAIDIFSGKKYESLEPSSHNCDVPNIGRKEYTVSDINDEDYVSLLDEGGNIREDLKLPTGTEDSDKLAISIQENYKAGNEMIITVLKSMGTEMISSIKITGL